MNEQTEANIVSRLLQLNLQNDYGMKNFTKKNVNKRMVILMLRDNYPA